MGEAESTQSRVAHLWVTALALAVGRDARHEGKGWQLRRREHDRASLKLTRKLFTDADITIVTTLRLPACQVMRFAQGDGGVR